MTIHHQSFGKTGRNTLSLLAGLLVCASAFAAPPDAGQSLQQLQAAPAPSARPLVPAPLPTAPAPVTGEGSSASLHLSRLIFTGNTAFSGDLLAGVAGNLHDQDVTLAQLQAAAEAITRYYRDHGYLVARAYLPQQQVRQGEITLAVMEGTLSGVTLNNHSRVSARQINGNLDHLTQGAPLQAGPANRSLLLLQALPGVGAVNASLHPGERVGSTALDVNLAPAPRVNGQIGVDNYGNSYTGRNRLSAGLNLPSLFGLGDQLSLQGAISQRDGLDYGRLSWDAPLGYDGLRLGAALSNTTYELGKDFDRLDAHGTAQTASLYGSYPLLLAPDHHLSLDASLEHRRLKDITGSFNQDSRKSANALVISLSGDNHDTWLGGGANAFRLSNASGRLSLDSADARLADVLADTQGDYDKLSLSLTRLQRLPARLSFYLGGSAQWASQNLDSSEKFFLGGANGVRAYPQGEGAGDEGWLVTAELRYRVSNGLQLKLFHDQGGLTLDKHTYTTGGNHRHLGGSGLGMDVDSPRHLTIGLALAWRSTGEPQSDDDARPRFWGQMAWRF